MAFWTIKEQQEIRPIDNNSLNKFAQLQNEVESTDLVKYLGFEFYQELVRNPSNYTTLLNGGNYTLNNYTYSFKGLKYVCAYLLYARYIRSSYIQDTPSGMIQHVGESFQRISSAELANQENRYKEVAGVEWDACYRYLSTLNLLWFPQPSLKSKLSYL
jgi:hypothetical protein